MKVICINETGFVDKEVDPIKEGEIYTVIAHKTYDNKRYYQLSELAINSKNHYPQWYASFRFIPLSSIDETEFEREYKKELV